MAKIREHTVEDSEKESTFSTSVTRFLQFVKILHCELVFAKEGGLMWSLRIYSLAQKFEFMV